MRGKGAKVLRTNRNQWIKSAKEREREREERKSKSAKFSPIWYAFRLKETWGTFLRRLSCGNIFHSTTYQMKRGEIELSVLRLGLHDFLKDIQCQLKEFRLPVNAWRLNRLDATESYKRNPGMPSSSLSLSLLGSEGDHFSSVVLSLSSCCL